jgi:hypothetical protein
VTISLVVNALSSSDESTEVKLCEQVAQQGGPSAAPRRRRFCNEEQEESSSSSSSSSSDENDKRKRANEGRALEQKRLAVRFLQKRMP